MIETLLSTPCTITKRAPSGEVDEYGDEVLSETEVETVCAIEQRRREEPGGSGEASDTDWRAYFLPTEEVNTASKLEAGDCVFEFVGDPWPVTDYELGTTHHIEASLRVA